MSRHGGVGVHSIWISTEPACGHDRFRLPRKVADAVNHDVAMGRPVIGIVDDHSSVRTAVGRLVRSQGFAAEVFRSGEEVLRAITLTGFWA